MDLLTDRVSRVAVGSVLYAGDRPLTVAESRPHQSRFLVTFEGVADRNAADSLRGVALLAPPLGDADDGDELWVHELIGARVATVAGVEVGVVDSIEANPAADLLVLSSGALVPAVFIVDRRSDGTVVIDPPQGLLDG